MQLLIDYKDESPISLRIASAVLAMLANLADGVEPTDEFLASMGQRFEPFNPASSINGKPDPIVLHPPTEYVPPGTISPLPAAAATFVPGVSTGAGTVEHLRGPNYAEAAILPFPQPTVTGATAPAAAAVPLVAPNATPPAHAMSFADLAASVLPVPTITQTAVLPATTTTATTVSPTPVVPVAATPSVPAPVAVSSVATVECDKDGLPWDARVHSETRKFNADGTWRYRRNLDPVVKATVYAELKAQYGRQVPLAPAAALVPAFVVPIAPVPQSAVPLPAGAIPSAPVAPQPPAAVPLPAATNVGVPNAPVQTVVSTAPVTGFRDLMSKVNKAQGAGLLTQAQLTGFCAAVGLDSVTALAGQPDKVPLVDSQINDLLRGAAAA